MSNNNDAEGVKTQYATPRNLNSRAALHRRFSTNKLGWENWVFQNYRLAPGQRILELGCGDAGIWAANTGKLPAGVRLTLTDLSPGMLEAAKNNTTGLGDAAEYAIIDVQSIPYSGGAFDVVIANHMLYHVPDIHAALGEIARVLARDGTFYATTVGNENMRELDGILFGFDPAIDYPRGSMAKTFGLKSGGALLCEYFSSVKVLRYADSLHITEPRPLVDYILSSRGLGNVSEVMTGGKAEEFSRYIYELFSKNGCIDIKQDAGMFIANK